MPTATQMLIKQPYEKRQYSIDFSNLMDADENISASPAPSMSSEKICGSTSDLTIDTVTIAEQTVRFWIDGGTNNTRYRIECRIETDAGAKLEGDGILIVRDK